ncbi:hypothetical protein ACF06N_28075 [Streptomyces albidoflavus]
MTGYLCPGCRVEQHRACTGNVDWYVAGYGTPALRTRCACPCCPQEVREVCDRCGGPCAPQTAVEHRTCRPAARPARRTPTEVTR